MNSASSIELRKQFMLENMKTDITFLVGPDEEKVPAFKQTLALFSPVFMKMLYGKMQSGDEIKIPEFEADDFKQLLNYVYFQQIEVEKCDPRNVYMIAHQYLIPSLCELCSPRVYTDVSEANVSEAIKWNQIYQDKEIWERIKQFFIKNAFEGLNAITGFKGLSKETVCEILKWNEMRCSVDLLYENLLEWTEQQLREQNKEINNTNKKEILVELCQLIGLRVNDDLSYDPMSYSISPYNWTKFEIDRDNSSFLAITPQDSYKKIKYFNSKRTCFGFKIMLSNIESDYVTEEFSISIHIDSKHNYTENFKIPVRDSLIIKDIYFKKPITVNPSYVGSNTKIEIATKFSTVKKRVAFRYMSHYTTFENIIDFIPAFN